MSERNSLPEGWAWTILNEVSVKIQDGTHFSPKAQSQNGTYKYITAKNVRSSGLDLDNVAHVSEADHRTIYKRCDPKKGDVLLVKDGVNTGDAAMNTLEEEFSLLSSVCLIRPRDLPERTATVLQPGQNRAEQSKISATQGTLKTS